MFDDQRHPKTLGDICGGHVFVAPSRLCFQRPSRVLGHQEPSSEVGDDRPVGEQFRVRLQQGQSEPPVQHVRIRVSDPAKMSDDPRGIHAQRRRLEPSERSKHLSFLRIDFWLRNFR